MQARTGTEIVRVHRNVVAAAALSWYQQREKGVLEVKRCPTVVLSKS